MHWLKHEDCVHINRSLKLIIENQCETVGLENFENYVVVCWASKDLVLASYNFLQNSSRFRRIATLFKLELTPNIKQLWHRKKKFVPLFTKNMSSRSRMSSI